MSVWNFCKVIRPSFLLCSELSPLLIKDHNGPLLFPVHLLLHLSVSFCMINLGKHCTSNTKGENQINTKITKVLGGFFHFVLNASLACFSEPHKQHRTRAMTLDHERMGRVSWNHALCSTNACFIWSVHMKAHVSLSAVMAPAEMDSKESNTVTLALICLICWATLLTSALFKYFLRITIKRLATPR